MSKPLDNLRGHILAWLGNPAQVESTGFGDNSVQEEVPSADGAKAIAELAYRRYSEEHARTKDIETKASPVLSILSAALIFGVGALSSGGACLTGGERVAFYIVHLIGVLLLLLAELNLFLVLTIQGFSYFHLADWARLEYTRRPQEELRETYEEIAGSYQRYTEENILNNNAKAKRYNRALNLVLFGVGIIVLDFMWAGCGVPRLW